MDFIAERIIALPSPAGQRWLHLTVDDVLQQGDELFVRLSDRPRVPNRSLVPLHNSTFISAVIIAS
jgi:hypothetical protein